MSADTWLRLSFWFVGAASALLGFAAGGWFGFWYGRHVAAQEQISAAERELRARMDIATPKRVERQPFRYGENDP